MIPRFRLDWSLDGIDSAEATATLRGDAELIARIGAGGSCTLPKTRVATWDAPPLRFATDLDALSTDPRPKLLALAQHDEFRDPASVVEDTDRWTATEVEVVGGASHFFVGRTDRVVDATRAFVERVIGARGEVRR